LLAATAQADAPTAPAIPFDLDRGPGAERCPDRDTLASQVGKRLSQTGSSARVPVADQVSIVIKRTRDGHVATLSALGFEGGIRNLVDTSEDCAGLAEALVLTLSMIADGRPGLPPRVANEPPPPRRVRPWELGASAMGSTGILGTPSAGMTVDVVWRPWPRLATGVSALWMPSRSFDKANGTTSFMVLAGMARVCGGILPFGGRVFPALCGEAGAGGLRGAGEGYADATSVWVPWLVAGGSLDLGLRVHRRFSLAARAGYLLSLRSEHFTGASGRV
jgi:hypothetical protein